MDVCSLSRRANLEPVSVSLQDDLRFFHLLIPARSSAPLAGSLLLHGGPYDIATFHISILTNDLGIACIPRLQCLRATHVIQIAPGAPTVLVTAYQRLWLLTC